MDIVAELITQTHILLTGTVLPGIKYDFLKNIFIKAISPIPAINQIHPSHNVAIPAIQGIVFNSDNELLQNMFYALLTKSMDKTQQEYAHPAFPKLLGQLSVDEILYLYCYVGQSCHSLFLKNSKAFFNYQSYIQKNRTEYFIESHLITLGVFKTERTIIPKDTRYSLDSKEPNIQLESTVNISPFGKQFIEACLSPEAEKLILELIRTCNSS